MYPTAFPKNKKVKLTTRTISKNSTQVKMYYASDRSFKQIREIANHNKDYDAFYVVGDDGVALPLCIWFWFNGMWPKVINGEYISELMSDEDSVKYSEQFDFEPLV
jgi:hypothetical protein